MPPRHRVKTEITISRAGATHSPCPPAVVIPSLVEQLRRVRSELCAKETALLRYRIAFWLLVLFVLSIFCAR